VSELHFFDEASDEAEEARRWYREYVLPTFPYSFVYFIEQDTIHVVAVAHQKRKPGYCRSKLK